MKSQVLRLARYLSLVAAMGLVLTVSAPDVSAQARGRSNGQEARTSGRGATAKKATTRKSPAKSTTQKATKKSNSKATSRASNGRGSTRNESATVQTGTPKNMSTPNGAKTSSRGTRTTTRSKGTDSGSRATTRSSGGTSGARATRDRTRGGRTTASKSRGDRTDRVIERNRRDRPAAADRTRAKRRVNADRRVRSHRPIVKGNRHYRYNRHSNRYVHVSSHLYLGLTWPWQVRYRRNWVPRYRYRQVVYVNAGWGASRRSERVDVSTTYSQRILQANEEFAEIEITIETIDISQGGQYLGYVNRIPNRVSRIRAIVWADGAVEFDKNVFVVGDRYAGFEIIATNDYDDYLLNAYRKDDRVDVASIDLRRHRARSVRNSRLFSPFSFNGNVPISLLPDDDRLWDYGSDVMSDWNTDTYRNRDLSVQYRTDGGLDVEMHGETYLERVD